MKKIALVTLLSAVVATPALADNTGTFYGALDLGQVSFSSLPVPNPSAFRIAGGVHINPIFAVEGGYSMIADSIVNTNFGGGTTGQEIIKSSALSVAGVANLAVNDAFSLIGKLGLAHSKIDYTCTTTGAAVCNPATVSGSKTNLTFGLGAQYNINQQFAIRAQYEDFGKLKVGTGTVDIGLTMMSLGGVYTF